MKITKLPNANKSKNVEREIARIQCNICPFCGEKEDYHNNLINRKCKGIDDTEVRRVKYRFFGLIATTFYSVTEYECHTCGAKWESEPYNFN